MTNSRVDLINYFSVPGKRVRLSEFTEFWESLTYTEKNYYRVVDLHTGVVDPKWAEEGVEVVM